ncbi:GntR family transcriptional regulator [Nocardia panacis]|uniref:GntR family transcriptional regulator n=1 Tax=Nocardia panacis TaxID=2340916 RepID=UPI00131523EB|nr:GntR family transcriptional regulator [Nocardia panacis]
MPEFEAVLPKYLRIAHDIRDRIERGELVVGDEVDSERVLAARWRVARPTAAKALNTLRRQGIVESRRGSGTYVADRALSPVESEHNGRTGHYGTPYLESPEMTVLAATMAVPPEHIAEVLGLSAEGVVIMRKRLATSQSGSTELAISWYPPNLAAVAPKLLVAEYLPSDPAVATGQRTVRARGRMRARLATAEEVESLRLGTPSAVLIHELTCYAADGGVIQVDEIVFPSGRWLFHQDWH